MAHDKTAAAIAEGWRAEALRLAAEAGDLMDGPRKLLAVQMFAKADALNECATDLMTNLHTTSNQARADAAAGALRRSRRMSAVYGNIGDDWRDAVGR